MQALRLSGSQANATAMNGLYTVAATHAGDKSLADTHDLSARLSVIVPCYNEVATVTELLRRARQALPQSQIIVVDDGSTDGSLDQIDSIRQRLDLCVHKLSCNSGKGTAFRAGLQWADREYVVIQDADLEYDPADISRLLRFAVENGNEVVYGSRYLLRGRRPGGAWGNYAAVVVLSQILKHIHGLRLTDPATGYKLFRREWLAGAQLRSHGFELCQELNRLVAQRQARVIELPVSYQPRNQAEGKKICAVDFWYAVQVLLGRSCLRAFVLIAGLILIAGCGRVTAISVPNPQTQRVEIGTDNSKDGKPDQPKIVWDCGAVLPGEQTRVSFPLELPGVSSAADITQIDTSCECTQVTLRDIASNSGYRFLARIEIDRSSEKESRHDQPLRVSVLFSPKQLPPYEAEVKVLFPRSP